MQISKLPMFCIIRNDFSLRTFKRNTEHLVTDDLKLKRKQKQKKFGKYKNVLFNDKKKFSIKQTKTNKMIQSRLQHLKMFSKRS